MSDVLRIVTLSPGGRPIVTMNLDDGATYIRLRDTFKFTPAAATQQTSNSARRYGGSRIVGESHDNGSVSWNMLVKGTTQDNAAVAVEAVLAAIGATATGRLLEWRPDSLTTSHSSYMRIMGPGTYEPGYRWAEWQGAAAMPVTVTFPVAPLVEWAPMNIWDDFSVNSITDYTFDALTAADTPIAGGTLTATTLLTTERRARHVSRGYDMLDVEAMIRFVPGATISGFKAGVILRAISATTYLEFYVDDNGTNSRLRIDKVIAGVRTNLASVNVSGLYSRIADGTAMYVNGATDGIKIYTSWSAYDMSISDSGMGSLNGSLNSGDQVTFAAPGKAGFSWIPQTATATLDDFRVQPYLFRGRSLPRPVTLRNIPGTVPARVDVSVSPTGAEGVASAWALFGWASTSPTFNMIWNGDFEDDTNGWLGVGGLVVGTSTLTKVVQPTTAPAKYGIASMQVVTPATIGAGADFRAAKFFKKGVAYTLEAWVRSAAQTTLINLTAGITGNIASGTQVALSTNYQKITVTWTPLVDTAGADFAVVIAAATVTTFTVDGVSLYEGAVAPTLASQIEGRGAAPPFGIFEAEDCDTGDLTNWVKTADATSHGGFKLVDTSAVGAKTYTAAWLFDPSLGMADEFTDGEISLEVWCRSYVTSTLVSPRLTASVRPREGVNFGTERLAAGGPNSMVLPTSGTVARFGRLGTLTLPVNRSLPKSVKLWLSGSIGVGSTGTFGIDYLVMVPSRARACSPSGKVLDTAFPRFITSIQETVKTIRSDLSGLVSKPPEYPFPDHGLGGNQLEIPPGSTDLLVKLSDLVPDDPTVNTTTEATELAAGVRVDVTPRSFMMRSA